ncbi:FliM/FliN family flagellar motor C-terminal domain-containing protein [Sandaracinobacter sp. RS1-74]|uniref:FliM/FliN family flagellar motor C-terminal domain-containing protein n=1 Tax=Sandaracinobacteroides sayramensis TaxID=2913411 RepID=UPI001EDB5235|nr:FliM/FliN family flagellar motor C-terminal domain-containing protein [Sandaracinobacteroides sayramensis]MCG2841958.1 FliM/FliN family flagellar motor C-terminal domain-containing protein [Sandaracinobacteroides sayramensis]
MARPIPWPSATFPEPPAEAPPAPLLPDAAGLAAAIGPELTRLFGARCAARRLDEAADISAASHVVARLRLPPRVAGAEPASLTLMLAPDGAGHLLDLLFGGGPAGDMPVLPPNSASWMTLGRFLAGSAGRALAAIGRPAAGPAEIPPRAVEHDGLPPQFGFRLEIDRTETLMALRFDGLEAGLPEPARTDPEVWRHQTRERALDLALPVALRLAEMRLPVAEVAALLPGSILPLERPEHVEILAAGRRLATLPASRLAPPQPTEENFE